MHRRHRSQHRTTRTLRQHSNRHHHRHQPAHRIRKCNRNRTRSIHNRQTSPRHLPRKKRPIRRRPRQNPKPKRNDQTRHLSIRTTQQIKHNNEGFCPAETFSFKFITQINATVQIAHTAPNIAHTPHKIAPPAPNIAHTPHKIARPAPNIAHAPHKAHPHHPHTTPNQPVSAPAETHLLTTTKKPPLQLKSCSSGPLS